MKADKAWEKGKEVVNMAVVAGIISAIVAGLLEAPLWVCFLAFLLGGIFYNTGNRN